MKNDLPNNITANELKKVQESLKVAREEKKKRTVYAEKDTQEIAKNPTIWGVTATIRKFQPKFPNLIENTVRPWVKSHKNPIQEQKKKKGETSVQSTIGKVRGRSLLTEEALNLKLHSALVNLRTAGAGINIHVVSGVAWFAWTQKDSASIWILKWQDHGFDHCTKGWNFHVAQSLYQGQ